MGNITGIFLNKQHVVNVYNNCQLTTICYIKIKNINLLTQNNGKV